MKRAVKKSSSRKTSKKTRSAKPARSNKRKRTATRKVKSTKVRARKSSASPRRKVRRSSIKSPPKLQLKLVESDLENAHEPSVFAESPVNHPPHMIKPNKKPEEGVGHALMERYNRVRGG